jgi:hypothetical protein
MSPSPEFLHAHTEPGIANAEEGFVVLDGPAGIAVTMTAGAAAGTGRSLIAAAEIAERQIADRDDENV